MLIHLSIHQHVHRNEQYSVPHIRNLEETYFYLNTEYTVNPIELQSNEVYPHL
jgi:hypothetical protein